MQKRIVRRKERIQTLLTMDVYRPSGSNHEESCNITLLSTRWTTSIPSFCGSACLPLLILVAPSSKPPAHTPTCQPKVHPQIHPPWEPSDAFFFVVTFVQAVWNFLDEKTLRIDQKLQMKSTTLERFLGVNGRSKGKGRFKLLIPHFACTEMLKWHVWHLPCHAVTQFL